MPYKFFLTPFEYNELAAKYAEEYGPDAEIPSLKEFQDMYEDIHQQAFRRMLPAMSGEEHITFKKICDRLKDFEWQALKKDYTECMCLGIESDSRIEGVARQVERFLRDSGYVIEKDEPENQEEIIVQNDTDVSEKKVIVRREVTKKEDPLLDLAKAFYKVLGDYIETRSA